MIMCSDNISCMYSSTDGSEWVLMWIWIANQYNFAMNAFCLHDCEIKFICLYRNIPLTVTIVFMSRESLFFAGLQFIHPIINIIVIYVLLRVAGGSKFSVAFAFLFNSVGIVMSHFGLNRCKHCNIGEKKI